MAILPFLTKGIIMARTANTEPKIETYLLIGGELIGFKTQKNLIQFAAMAAFDDKTLYHKHEGYRIEDNETIVDFPKEPADDELCSLLTKIADKGFKADFRLHNDLVIRFATRLKAMNWIGHQLINKKYRSAWKKFGAEQIGEPRIVDWSKMNQAQKIEFMASL